jgi:uncharacterized membrane protein YdcZ (DUF606 family)
MSLWDKRVAGIGALAGAEAGLTGGILAGMSLEGDQNQLAATGIGAVVGSVGMMALAVPGHEVKSQMAKNATAFSRKASIRKWGLYGGMLGVGMLGATMLGSNEPYERLPRRGQSY